jgi:protein-disulfide isomerase
MSGTSQAGDLAVPVNPQDHIQGPSTAPVTLVEYADFECSYCGAAYPVVKDVQRQAGDQLRFVFRNFPLVQSHPHAEHAAEAAESAAAQGKFWEMHDTLFEHQHALDDDHLLQYAAELGLDQQRFDADMAQHRYAGKIEEDLEGGEESGVPGTPTFFINGVMYEGAPDPQSLLEAIREAGKRV